MNNKTRYIVYSSVLLALGILFQSIRILLPGLALISVGPFNLQTLVIGSLVNLVIIIAAWYVGLWSGVAVSIATPLFALLQGHLAVPHMFLVIAIGNTLVAVFVRLFYTPKLGVRSTVGVILGVIAKFLAQWMLVAWIVAPYFTPNAQVASKLSAGFSWIQLVAGVTGAVLAFVIYPRLRLYRTSQK